MTLTSRAGKKPWWLLVSAILFSLLLVEVFLRLFPSPWLYYTTRHIVHQTHSEKSENAILGYVPKANLEKPFTNREFKTQVRINSDHMRDRSYSLQKPAGVKRIVVVGNSFVFGWGVERAEIFTEIMEDELLTNIEVLNMGVSGYCEIQNLERVRADGLKYQPDIVIFETWELPVGCAGDDEDASAVFEGDFMYWSDLNRDSWWVRLEGWLIKNVYLYAYLRAKVYLRGFGRSESSVRAEGVSDSELVDGEVFPTLDALKKLGAEHDFTPIILYHPEKKDIIGSPRYVSQANQRVLTQYIQDKNMHLIDLTDALTRNHQRDRSPYFKLDEHWNRVGHEVVAHEIVWYLEEKSLI